MNLLRISSIAPLAILLTSCAAVPPTDYTLHQRSSELNLVLHQRALPVKVTNQQIEFRGVPSNDDRITTANMLYSDAAGVGGVGAQVAAHAASVRSAQDRKLKLLREQADMALKPLEGALEGLQISDLHQASVPGRFHISIEDEVLPDELVVWSYPIFFVTDSLDSISITNVISLRKTTDSRTLTLYQNLVEVVRDMQGLEAPLPEIGRDGLQKIIRDLYAESVVLALDDMAGQFPQAENVHESFRFYQGERLRVERGTGVEFNRNQTTVRNLRGWLIRYSTPHCDHCRGSVAGVD